MVRGRHHFVFGGEAIVVQMNSVNVTFGNGEFAFNGSLSNDPIADFMLGRPSSLLDSNTSVVALRQKYYGLYFQDDIQVNKRLEHSLPGCGGSRLFPSTTRLDGASTSRFPLSSQDKRQPKHVHQRAGGIALIHGDPGIPAAYANGSYGTSPPRIGLALGP